MDLLKQCESKVVRTLRSIDINQIPVKESSAGKGLDEFREFKPSHAKDELNNNVRVDLKVL